MKTKLTAKVLAVFLSLFALNGGGSASGFGGPGFGTLCVAICSAEKYQRDMVTMQQLEVMLAACDASDDPCRDAAGAWAEAEWAESRRLWEACEKSCQQWWM